ncbi:MAG TPA: glycerol-3-phosphate 1-O-acyltransferase PlsY [Candidatus Binatia bacterium]|nr:glycerol-3-phosphate 1-O-acyltransferase PlsY [Candidatus Binatia bacterium]
MPAGPLLVLLGYACGSIPFGVLLARRVAVDVRRAGSGNIGAANVARTAGPALGLATLVADAAKGAVPTLVAGAATGDARVTAAAGLAAFLGHVFPVTLRFAGGKGVATALGVLAVLCPLGALAAVVTFAAVFAAARWVSLASIAAAATAPLATAALGCTRAALATAAVMAAVIAVRHRDNVRRLRAGTEPRFRLREKRAAPEK